MGLYMYMIKSNIEINVFEYVVIIVWSGWFKRLIDIDFIGFIMDFSSLGCSIIKV